MILITGASRGIGKFLLESFIKEGEKVVGTFNNTYPDDSLNAYMMKVDITNKFEVKEWLSKIDESQNKLVLINCAGINYNAVAHKVNIDNWKEVIDINLVGTFNVISNILPFMRNKNYGRIRNFY